MAFANSAISDIIATTIESRTKSAQDNLTNNNALLLRLKERGNVKTISGGSTILQELFYNDPATNYASSYSGYETINISPDSPISAAQFNLKHYADAVTISGPEMLANSGKEAMIELLATRVEIAEARLQNKIDIDLHGDGTGNAGKNLVGLAAMISTSPSTGTYGGIDRATWTFWRNGAYTSTGLAGVAATAANIQNSMNTVALSVVRGTDHVDLIYAGSTAYSLYLASLQAIQRITDDRLGAAGFSALKFYGGAGSADVVLGGGIGGNQTATRMDFINTKYVYFRPHKDRNFVPIGGDRQAVNQDAIVRLMGFSGALTCSGAQFNATFSTTQEAFMAYNITTPLAGFQGIAITDTTQNHALGTIVTAVDPTYGAGEFIYLKGVASTVVGSLVDYDSYLATTALAPATGGVGQVAVAMSANVASQYGWYQIAGIAAVKAPNAMTVGADVYMLAATPGSVDDAQVNGEQILNAKVSTTTGTPSSGLALIQINRPFHQGQVV